MRPARLARSWCLAAALLGGWPPRGLADGAGAAAPVGTEGLSELQLRTALEALLDHGDAAVREAALAAVQDALPTELPAAPLPWYCDPQLGYPYVLFALELALVGLLVAAWETLWLRSSLCGRAFCRRLWRRRDPPCAAVEGTPSDPEEERAERAVWGQPHVEQFWAGFAGVLGSAPEDQRERDGGCFSRRCFEGVRGSAAPEGEEERDEGVLGSAPEGDEVSFSRRYFVGRAGGHAHIDVRRKGAALEPLTVLVRAHESAASSHAAKAGRDFHAFERELEFAAGETCQTFEVELPRGKEAWAPTAWFRVELAAVVSGRASLGGPTVQREAQLPIDSQQGPIARVFILQDVNFPPGAPEHLWSEEGSGFRLMIHYLAMQRRARGEKWIKTLAGLLYDPIHSVVVTAFVNTWMLDWAASQDGPRDYHSIMLLVWLYMLSVFLNRWADIVQTRNRGRTGGVRMGHRRDLFSKKMMLDHVEQCQVPAEQWFYAALRNVDVITMDCYWQGFVFLQSVFALLLSVAVILIQAGLNHQYTPGHTITFALLFLVVPLAAFLSAPRQVRTQELLQRRGGGEAMWVDTWAWLTNAGSQLFSFGPREKARVEANFAEESKAFVGWHQKARDELNDTAWIIRWSTATAYALILGHGGIVLLRGDLTSGQFVLLLSVAKSYSKYLNRVYESVVYMQRGSVCLKKLCRLMNLPEHRSLREDLERRERETRLGIGSTIRRPKDLQQLEFRGVQLDLPAGHDLRPLSALRLRAGAVLSIPLGRVVRIKGGSEGLRYSFMALASGVVQPTRGSVVRPGDVWAINMATTPMRSSHLTVLEALQLAGARREVAEHLARALGLAADQDTRTLAPGELQTLALVRAMLRDPDILVASRPLSHVLRGFRTKLVRLLRAWQAGGAGAVLTVVGNVTASISSELAADESPGQVLKSCTIWTPGRRRRRRTLLVTDEDMGDGVVDDVLGDVHVNLDEFVEEAPPLKAPSLKAQKRWRL